jgi:hypothetical protein
MLHSDRKTWLRRWLRRSLVLASSALLLTACGSDSDSESTAAPASTTSAGPATSAVSAAPPTTGAGAGASAGCPITVDALGSATSLRWELRDRQENHLLETSNSIRTTVCVFTAGAALQQGGDPLVFRTDVVTGSDAAVVRRDFAATCASINGATRASGGGSVCDRNGVVVEGLKGDGDRVVMAAFENADNAVAASLTPAFTKVLDALR